MSRRLRVIAGSASAQPRSLEPREIQGSVGGTSLETERANAEARGYARGLEAGKAAAEEGFQEDVRRMSAALAAAMQAFSRAADETGREAVEAALRCGVEIARLILDREVALDPDVALRTVEGALARMPGARDLEVRVNPSDLDHLSESGFLRDALQAGEVRFVADASVDRGGCVVHSEAGVLDARLKTQLGRALEHAYGFEDESEEGEPEPAEDVTP